jgi:hypothetical protein
MAARVWFTQQNTPSLPWVELAVLNRAARIILFGSSKSDLTREELVAIRNLYKQGMSASKLVDAYYDEPTGGDR